MIRFERPPVVSARARAMAAMMNQGQTQRAIAAKFNLTPARISQIVGNTAIRSYLWENGGNDGYRVWRDVFDRNTRNCAAFIEKKIPR
jgi:hypothetical protein